MNDKEVPNSRFRIAKTRMPFRVAGFAFGMLFVAVGLYRLSAEPSSWMQVIWAICVALAGLHFAYSALTEDWNLPLTWQRRSTFKQTPRQFLVVEPASPSVGEVVNAHRVEALAQLTNPYSPPNSSAAVSTVFEPSPFGASQELVKLFLAGYPLIHDGVVFFVDSQDDSSIHAAIPLATLSDHGITRNTNEAVRVLSDLLAAIPSARPLLSGRQLVIRMISSYEDLNHELGNRVVVSPSSLQIENGESCVPDRGSDNESRTGEPTSTDG